VQKNVSPVVAIIVIVAVIAVIAFLWLRFTGPPEPRAGTPGAGGGRAAGVGAPRGGGRERPTRERGARRGREGRGQPATPPGGGEAQPSPE